MTWLVLTLNSPINIRHGNCAVLPDPFHLKSYLIIGISKTIW